jgi:hypothetical protein
MGDANWICDLCQAVISFGISHFCRPLFDGPRLPDQAPIHLTIVKRNQYNITNNITISSPHEGVCPATPTSLDPISFTPSISAVTKGTGIPAQSSSVNLVPATNQAMSGSSEPARVVLNNPTSEVVGVPVHVEFAPLPDFAVNQPVIQHVVSGTIGTWPPTSGVFGRPDHPYATRLGSVPSGLRIGPGDESIWPGGW